MFNLNYNFMNALNSDFIQIIPEYHGWEVSIPYGNYTHERCVLGYFPTESQAIDYVAKLDLV